jgi:hypothetical protein
MSAAEPNSRKPLRKRSKPPMLLSSCGRQTQSSPRGFGTKRRSGGTLDAWSWVDLRYGNLAEAAGALKLMQSGKVSASRIGEAFVRARPDQSQCRSRSRIGHSSRPDVDRMAELIGALGEFRRTDELLNFLLAARDESQFPYFVEILFRPSQANLRADPRFMQVAAHLGLLDYWRRSEDWPDFCSDPDLPYDCKKEAARLTT